MIVKVLTKHFRVAFVQVCIRKSGSLLVIKEKRIGVGEESGQGADGGLSGEEVGEGKNKRESRNYKMSQRREKNKRRRKGGPTFK